LLEFAAVAICKVCGNPGQIIKDEWFRKAMKLTKIDPEIWKIQRELRKLA